MAKLEQRSNEEIMENDLVSASWGSWGVTGLGVGGPLLAGSFFGLHTGEVDIGAHWVFVPGFSGVSSRSIRAVSLPGFVGVEVHGGTFGVWVPGGVNFVLSFGSP